MRNELILDIGIGPGGKYINKSSNNALRIGVDLSINRLLMLGDHYPDVLPVNAKADKLPFADSTFSKIEMVLPDGELAFAGLQHNHFILTTHAKLGARYPDKSPCGWYPEFARVLKPRGEMVIYADYFVDPEQVRKTANDYFKVLRTKRLSMQEFINLGTTTTELLRLDMPGTQIEEVNDIWENRLVKLNLRSKKLF